MPYTLDASKVQLVTVMGQIAGQQIINRLYYSYKGVLPNPDADRSDLWLENFVIAWRTNILPVAWDDYKVTRYTMVEYKDVELRPAPKTGYRVVLDPSKFQQQEGAIADTGGIASAGATKIPTHEAMRLRLNVADRIPKRFRSNYLRLSLGFAITVLGATAEQWTAGSRTTYKAAFDTLIATDIHGVGVPVGVGYFASAFSIPYYFLSIKGGADPMSFAARQFASSTVEPFIGTQITRRFFPLGGFRGI